MDDRDRRADRGPERVLPGGAGWDEEGDLGALFGVAGPRPEIPRVDLAAITDAARAEWRQKVEETSRRRAAREARLRAGLVAAVLVVASVAIWWWVSRPSVAPPAVVARVEVVTGSVRLEPAGGRVTDVVEGLALAAGTEIETNAAGEGAGRLSLRLEGGVTVRMDSDTRLRIAAADGVELLRGAVYVDTESDIGGLELEARRIEVRTPVGTASDVGTRFAVRLLEPRTPALRVRVRDGAVLVAQRGQSYRAGAGEEIVLHGDGTVERWSAPSWGEDWGWVLDAAPRFDLEGRTLAEFLDWVSRETGWSVRFEDERMAASAREITLHGSLGGLRPDQAPFAVLPGAGLEGSLDGGTLTVRRVRTP